MVQMHRNLWPGNDLYYIECQGKDVGKQNKEPHHEQWNNGRWVQGKKQRGEQKSNPISAFARALHATLLLWLTLAFFFSNFSQRLFTRVCFQIASYQSVKQLHTCGRSWMKLIGSKYQRRRTYRRRTSDKGRWLRTKQGDPWKKAKKMKF